MNRVFVKALCFKNDDESKELFVSYMNGRNSHVLYQVNNLLKYEYSLDHVLLILYSISDLHYIKHSSQEIICFTIDNFCVCNSN